MTDLPLEWSYNPWRDRPGQSVGTVVAALLLCAVPVSWHLPLLTTLVLCVVIVAALASALLPVRCRIDEHGVMRRSGGFTERRDWDQLGRAERRRAGLWLSPYRGPHVLDPYRALFLPLPDHTGPSNETLERVLLSHGL